MPEPALTTADKPRPGRLQFLDGLRGLAAGVVLISHGGERMSGTVDGFISHALQLGQLGVALFFTISGFVIPLTLERRGQVGFWLSRVFRLFPLYLFILFLAWFLAKLGLWATHHNFSPAEWLANTTMLQHLFRTVDAVGTFWTLEYELFFYLAMSALLLVGLNRYSITLALISLTLVNIGLHYRLPWSSRLDWQPMFFALMSFMFVGTVFYRHYQGRIRLPALAAVCGYTALTLGHLAYQRWWGTTGGAHGTQTFTPMLAAWLGALTVFVIGYSLRSMSWPRVLLWLGAISYSVYLVHLIVMDLGRRWRGQPRVFVDPRLTYLGYIGLTLLVAWLTYRLIERPGIQLGHRLANRLGSQRQRQPRVSQDDRAGGVPGGLLEQSPMVLPGPQVSEDEQARV